MDVITTVRVIVSLAVVAAILWLGGRYLTKSQRTGRREKVLHLVDRQNVGGKASVVVVDAADVRLVLGVSEHGMNVLHTGQAPGPEPATTTEPDQAEAGDGAFAKVLAGVSTRGEGEGTSRTHGSIFSASTWRQAAAAVRGGKQ